eukprot:m.1307340 g.1307340  ORF g.1307340 m.1307340 type:complete len:78 (+) comp24818_c0_seq8:2-235(+)
MCSGIVKKPMNAATGRQSSVLHHRLQRTISLLFVVLPRFTHHGMLFCSSTSTPADKVVAFGKLLQNVRSHLPQLYCL